MAYQVIVVALGIEIRDSASGLRKFLQDNCTQLPLPPAPSETQSWQYPKRSQGQATHEIRVVFEMSEFTAALDAPDAFVVYEGHSRYGQGPAFGPAHTPHVPSVTAFPANPWGVHFRMGYLATDTDAVDDLVGHSVTPAEYDLGTADPNGFLPGALATAIRGAKKAAAQGKAKKPCSVSGAWRSIDVCKPALAARTTARGDVPLKGRHYYREYGGDLQTAVHVGSGDLDKTKLACRVLFMASCSSEVHFRAALVRHRKKVGSACTFMLTSYVCSSEASVPFLRSVLLKKQDPRTPQGMKAILKAVNSERDSGAVGAY